jgi:hypothetical protein
LAHYYHIVLPVMILIAPSESSENLRQKIFSAYKQKFEGDFINGNETRVIAFKLDENIMQVEFADFYHDFYVELTEFANGKRFVEYFADDDVINSTAILKNADWNNIYKRIRKENLRFGGNLDDMEFLDFRMLFPCDVTINYPLPTKPEDNEFDIKNIDKSSAIVVIDLLSSWNKIGEYPCDSRTMKRFIGYFGVPIAMEQKKAVRNCIIIKAQLNRSF